MKNKIMAIILVLCLIPSMIFINAEEVKVDNNTDELIEDNNENNKGSLKKEDKDKKDEKEEQLVEGKDEDLLTTGEGEEITKPEEPKEVVEPKEPNDKDNKKVEPSVKALKKSVKSLPILTGQQLKSEIENAVESYTIVLTSDFDTSTFSDVVINKSNAHDIVVDFSNLNMIMATGKILNIPSNTAGSLQFINMKIDATNANGTVVSVGYDATHIKFINVEIINSHGINFDVNTLGEVAFDSITIKDSTDYGIYMEGSNSASYISVSNSHFENIVKEASGYDGAAIVAKAYRGTLVVENSIFRNNKNTYSGKIAGGRAPAISLTSTGNNTGYATKYIIRNNIFDGNSAAMEGNSDLFDAGAVMVFDLNKDQEAILENNLFVNNTSGDDAGALLLQGRSTAAKVTLNNNTFMNNTAHGKGANDSGKSGGAIQVYIPGFSNGLNVTMNNNTFVGNKALASRDNQKQMGGAVAVSGMTIKAKIISSNNIFLNNEAYLSPGVLNESKYMNASFTRGSGSGVDIGFSGASDTLTSLNVFGTEKPTLQDNKTRIYTGSPDAPEAVKTLLIAPKTSRLNSGLADGGFAKKLEFDGRGKLRGDDAGSTEITVLRIDANTGVFGADEHKYDGRYLFDPEYNEEYFVIGGFNESVSIPDRTYLKLSKPGYRMIGLSRDKDAKVGDSDLPEYYPNKVNFSITLPEVNETIYVVWQKIEVYSLTYNGNGSDNDSLAPIDLNEYIEDAVTTVAGQGSLVKDGYTFTGWNTDANGLGTNYAVDSSITMNESITLYAQWTKNEVVDKYTITYNGNGSDNDSLAPIDLSDYIEGAVAPVTDQGSLVKVGYTFTGWNTDANGLGTNYAVDSSITMNESITLYAQWTKNEVVDKYTITYNGNGSDNDSDAPVDLTQYLKDASAFIADKGSLVKTGYTFTGWNTKANGSGSNYAEGVSITMSQHYTLYAQWSKKQVVDKYTIIYNGNGSDNDSNAPIDSNEYLNNTVAVTLDQGSLTKEGHSFMGWNTSTDGSGTTYAVSSSITMTQSITLYAQWTKDSKVDKYTITYYGNGSDNDKKSPVDSLEYMLNAVATISSKQSLTKKGYVFIGWNTSKDGSGTTYAANAKVAMTESLNLYAQWKKIDVDTGLSNKNYAYLLLLVSGLVGIVVQSKKKSDSIND